MKFSLLCSGSKGNCCVIQGNSETIVIDCGSTKRYLTESFNTIGIDYSQVDALLLTHDHSDHISQINLFSNRNIYAPFSLKSGMESYRVSPYHGFKIGSFSILPIALSHDTDINVGYVFDDGFEKLVYITDTGYVKESDFGLISGAEYYIFESNHDPETLMKTKRPYFLKQRILSDTGHLSNEDSAFILQKVITTKTREIVLAHLSEEANTPQIALDVMKGALKNYSDSLSIRAARQFKIVSGGM